MAAPADQPGLKVTPRLQLQGSFPIPVESVASDNTFVTPPGTGYRAFRGTAAFANIGWAAGPYGGALYKIKLGDGISQGIGSEQVGFALGEGVAIGTSFSKGTKSCCE